MQGHYPEELLQYWDDYDVEKGSENDRPGPELLPMDQKFVTLVYSNGGRDLEVVELPTAMKAMAIFNQMVHSLARKEQ